MWIFLMSEDLLKASNLVLGGNLTEYGRNFEKMLIDTSADFSTSMKNCVLLIQGFWDQ